MVGRPSMASEKRAYTGERATDSRRRASLDKREEKKGGRQKRESVVGDEGRGEEEMDVPRRVEKLATQGDEGHDQGG